MPASLLFIGATELIFIAFIVLILFGSKRIPYIMRDLGMVMNRLRNASQDMKDELMKGIEDPIANPIKDIQDEVKASTEGIKKDIKSQTSTIGSSFREATEGVGNSVKRSASPPPKSDTPNKTTDQPSTPSAEDDAVTSN